MLIICFFLQVSQEFDYPYEPPMHCKVRVYNCSDRTRSTIWFPEALAYYYCFADCEFVTENNRDENSSLSVSEMAEIVVSLLVTCTNISCNMLKSIINPNVIWCNEKATPC